MKGSIFIKLLLPFCTFYPMFDTAKRHASIDSLLLSRFRVFFQSAIFGNRPSMMD